MFKVGEGVNKFTIKHGVSCCREHNNRLWPLFLAMLAALTYVLFLPGGMLGYGLPLFAFFISCFFTTRKSLGVFCLLIGPPAFGGIFRSFDIPYAGSLLAFGLAFVTLISHRKEVRSIKLIWYPSVVLWIFFTIGILLVNYLFGPQTEYSFHKLTGFVQGLFLSIIAFIFLLKSHYCDMWEVGMLGIFAGLAAYAAILFSFPSFSPNSIFVTGDLRFSLGMEDIIVATNTLALITSTGLVFLLSSLADEQFTYKKNILTIMLIATGLIVLNSIGQRLFMFLPIICSLGMLACKPIKMKIIFGLFVGLFIITAIVIFIGIQSQNSFITSVFLDNSGIADRSNRSINWEAAISRINERPWLGHGLGGYYIEGFSAPGSGTYAHNMVLELLSETGFVGSLIILGPIILFLTRYSRPIILLRTVRGQIIFPILIMFFGHSMISHDLTTSSWFLGLIACLWVYFLNSKKHREAKIAIC